MRRAVFLDRDGVLNHAVVKKGKPYPPKSVEELTIPHDVKAALTQLKAAGFLLIGATNQPDVARGTVTQSEVEAINQALMKALPLDEIRVCYHDDHDQCDCRKPFPGLLTKAAEDYAIDLNKSVMIGDRWKDIEAGQRAGCKTIWLNQCYEEKAPEAPNFIASNLSEAALWCINFLLE